MIFAPNCVAATALIPNADSDSESDDDQPNCHYFDSLPKILAAVGHAITSFDDRLASTV